MMERLKADEWIGFAPSHVGKVRANHTADYCEGGRQSMVIERKEDGYLSAYCFRCNRSGFAYSGGNPYPKVAGFRKRTAESADDSGQERELLAGSVGRYTKRSGPPATATHEWGRYSPLAQAWLLKARVSPVIAMREGFLWDDCSQELFIPVRQNGVLIGWQARTFGVEGRKYDTMTEDSSTFYAHYITGSRVLLVTEDVLSALRGSEICDSIGLLGVSIKPSIITKIAQMGYEECVVFLDGDNSQVKLAARKIVKKLPFLRTRIVETGKDPKHYSKEELECLILR